MDDEEQPELFRRWKETHSPLRKIYDVFMKATRRRERALWLITAPETCRLATQEEMQRFRVKVCPRWCTSMKRADIDCYFTETEAVITRPAERALSPRIREGCRIAGDWLGA